MRLALIACLVLLAACSATPTRTVYPEVGMTSETVESIWGTPSDTSYREGPLGPRAAWYWIAGRNVLAMHFRPEGGAWVLTDWNYTGSTGRHGWR